MGWRPAQGGGLPYVYPPACGNSAEDQSSENPRDSVLPQVLPELSLTLTRPLVVSLRSWKRFAVEDADLDGALAKSWLGSRSFHVP